MRIKTWWFDGPQLPHSIIKKGRVEMNQTVDGYEADSEKVEKSLAPVAKKRRNANLVEIQEWGIFESNRRNESDENDRISDENIMHTKSNQMERFSESEEMIVTLTGYHKVKIFVTTRKHYCRKYLQESAVHNNYYLEIY